MPAKRVTAMEEAGFFFFRIRNPRFASIFPPLELVNAFILFCVPTPGPVVIVMLLLFDPVKSLRRPIIRAQPVNTI